MTPRGLLSVFMSLVDFNVIFILFGAIFGAHLSYRPNYSALQKHFKMFLGKGGMDRSLIGYFEIHILKILGKGPPVLTGQIRPFYKLLFDACCSNHC